MRSRQTQTAIMASLLSVVMVATARFTYPQTNTEAPDEITDATVTEEEAPASSNRVAATATHAKAPKIRVVLVDRVTEERLRDYPVMITDAQEKQSRRGTTDRRGELLINLTKPRPLVIKIPASKTHKGATKQLGATKNATVVFRLQPKAATTPTPKPTPTPTPTPPPDGGGEPEEPPVDAPTSIPANAVKVVAVVQNDYPLELRGKVPDLRVHIQPNGPLPFTPKWVAIRVNGNRVTWTNRPPYRVEWMPPNPPVGINGIITAEIFLVR